ncbi:MAG: hypothetical protein KDB26_13960, partial [Microthrixaceae bacterium]|nr:hypothetical protein [Microthrixaceae bacterium]
AEKERAWYSRPETEYQGGNNVSPDTFFVKHYAAPLPVAALPHPADGEYRQAPVWFAPGLMKYRNGDLQGDQSWMEQARETKKVWDEIADRYTAILGKLRDAEWWQRLCEDAGVTRSDKPVDMTWEGQYSSGTYKLTTITVPTIRSVRIAEDGLRLIVKRNGDAARDWVSKLDYLRAGFKSGGMNAAHLRITETVSGDIELVFDDAPSSFPPAVCIEPPTSPAASREDAIRRYRDAAWTLGVDSRGKVLKFRVEEFPHVLVVGGTGAGKSVWARSVIEMFRTGYRDPDTGRDTAGGFTCFVSSGKVTDFVTLSKLPGVAMVAGDAAQTAAMVHAVRVEAERRYDEAAAAKLRGETGKAFHFQPIILLLDEWGATWLAMDSAYKSAKSFETDIDWVLRVGREARVHVVLLSQTIRKTGAGAVPGSWQANLGLTISLGKPEAETYNNPAVFPGGSRERAERVGNSLAGKNGRGMAVLAGEVTEFQSYYVWSPGTTSLADDADKKVAPPTSTVRELWKKWEPISASVPWLTPRLGLKVTGPDWLGSGDGKAELEEVASTPIIPISNRDGTVKPGMDKYDPWSTEFLGRARRHGSAAASVVDFDDEPATAPAPSAVPVPVPSGQEPEPAAGAEPDPLAGVSAEELAAALALIKKTRTPQPAAAPAPEPPKQTEQPTPDQEEDDGW